MIGLENHDSEKLIQFLILVKGILKNLKGNEDNSMMIRGNMKNWFMLVSLVLVMVVAGEVWGISAASAAKPIKLRVMVPAEPVPAQFSPVSGFTSGRAEPIIYNVMEPLIDVGKQGKPVPKLATSWKQLNPTTWRFYLRKGVKFHNGDSFTARDVVELAKWNFEERKTSKLYARVPIKEAVAMDDYTVDLIFEQPQPLLLIYIRMFLILPTTITGGNRAMAGTHPIGTGPYRFVEWQKGLNIRLAKFEGYWGPKPQIDDVEITFRGEGGVRLAGLMAGEADWVPGLNPEQSSKAPKLAHMPGPETVWLKFDEAIQREWTGKDPILADKRLRLAVEYAIDRQALVAMQEGLVTLSLGQFASPGDFGFNPNLKNRPYDLEKAKALVKEAGAVGKTLSLVGSTDRWSKDREVAEAIAYMIEQSGLKVRLMLLPQEQINRYKSVSGENRKLKADIVLSPSDAFQEVETRLYHILVEGGDYCTTPDPETTRLYKEVLAEADYAKRGEKLAKVWAYVYEQVHYIPLFKLKWIWGMAKNLEWDIDIIGRPFFTDMRFTD